MGAQAALTYLKKMPVAPDDKHAISQEQATSLPRDEPSAKDMMGWRLAYKSFKLNKLGDLSVYCQG